MALASSSKVEVSFLEEATPGTVATGAPRLLRNTDPSGLSYSVSRSTSAEVNATRQTPDSVITDAELGGAINIEMLYREFDAFIEALLASTFSTAFGTDGVKSLTVTFATAGNTITDDGIDGFAGLVAGQWIMIKDSVANNGLYRIASMTNDVLTLDAATPLVANGTADVVSISSARITNGTAALRTFSIQKNFTDVAQFFVYRGCGVSQLQLSMTTGSILTGSFGFMGFDSERGATTFFTAGANPATSFGVMNSVTGVGRILVDGAVLSGTYVQSATINIDAKLRGQKAIGSLGNVGLGEGTFEIGGNLTVYLADGTLYDTALADSAISLAIPVMDVNNNGYVFIFDNIKLAVPQLQNGTKDQDVMLSMDFTAHAPAMATDKMIRIDRFGDALV